MSTTNNNSFFNSLEMKEHLFDKILTPTDADGKSARILIPKQHALDYFPPLPENGQRNTVLHFADRNGKTWRFEYWFWKTSNSGMYVLKHEWGRFLGEKQLVAGDTVSFYHAYIPNDNGPERRRRILLIDWSYGIFSPFYRNQFQGREGLGLGVIGGSHNAGESLVHPWEPSQPRTKRIRLFGVDVEETKMIRLFGVYVAEYSSSIGYSSLSQPKKKIRLFGVDIEESSSVCTSLFPAVIRDDGQSSQRSPSDEMGASSSSFKPPSDDEDS